jgi:endoglucanase
LGDGATYVSGVTLNKTTLSLTAGGTETLTVTVTPDTATNKTLNWESSNPGVATVTNGAVTAVAAGTATITVTPVYGANNTIKATCTVTVTAPNPSDPLPETPEAMSTKTAMQYFTDNNIRAGWNLGNSTDAVTFNGAVAVKAEETAAGNPLATQALFNGVKQSGFDIVRITCTWVGHIGAAPDYKINEARLRRIAEIIGYAKTAGIKAVIINIHHDGNNTRGNNTTWGFVDMPAAVNNPAKKTEIQNEISKVWTQIAEYFKNYGDYLIFETLNEVHNGNWGNGASTNEQDILFDWNQAALSAIRATGGKNATRYVAVPGLGSTEPDIVVAANNRNKLLPNDGSNGTNKLIVSVHYYAPAQYTVAGVTDQVRTPSVSHHNLMAGAVRVGSW